MKQTLIKYSRDFDSVTLRDSLAYRAGADFAQSFKPLRLPKTLQLHKISRIKRLSNPLLGSKKGIKH